MRLSSLLLPLLLVTPGLAAAQEKEKAKPSPGLIQLPITIGPQARVQTAATLERTMTLLRNSGVLSPILDRAFTLSGRQPYLDAQTFLLIGRASVWTDRNIIAMDGLNTPAGASVVVLNWNGNPERRYVVDCAFYAGVGFARFQWALPSIDSNAPPSHDEVPIAGGRAAIVLPLGASSRLEIQSQNAAELSGCEVTPFGG